MRIHQIYNLVGILDQNNKQLFRDKTRTAMVALLVAEFDLKNLLSGKAGASFPIHPTEQDTLDEISRWLASKPDCLAQAKRDLTEILSQISTNGVNAVNLPQIADPVSMHPGDNMALDRDEIQFLLDFGALTLDYLPEDFQVASLPEDFLPILKAGLSAKENLELYEEAQEEYYARLAGDSNTAESALNTAAFDSRKPETLGNILKHQNADLRTYYAVARNEDTDAVTLAFIANHPQAGKHKQIMPSVAYNPNTDEATLESIANNPAINDDRDILLSIAFAFNPGANEATLASLVANPDTPTEALQAIAMRGPNHDAQIAAHAKTGIVTLASIAQRTNVPAILQAIVARNDYFRYSDEEQDSCFLAVAQNPQTLTADLTSIAQNSTDRGVLVAVANHNNADKGTLLAIDNSTNDADVLREVLQRDQADADVLEKISITTNVFDEVIANNPKTASGTLDSIARRTDLVRTLEAIVKNNNVNHDVLIEVAANNHVSAEVLHLVTEHPIKTDDIDEEVVASGQTSAADLTTIAGRTSQTNILENIAKHDNADKNTLLAVLNNANVTKAILQDVVDHDQTDADVLHAIVEHAVIKSKTLDERLALHPQTATADLITLANRAANKDILLNIANNPKADVDTLTAVLNNTNVDDGVRKAVVGNPNADSAIYKIMFNSSTLFDATLAANPRVQAADLTIIAGRTTDAATLVSVANNPSAELETLTAVLDNAIANDDVYKAVAVNRKADLPMLRRIAASSAVVDTALAGNPNMEAADLAVIVGRAADAATLLSVVGNPSADLATLTAVLTSGYVNADVLVAVAGNQNADEAILEDITKRDAGPAADAAVAANARTHADDLQTIAARRSADPVTCLLIAKHGNANAKALKYVAKANLGADIDDAVAAHRNADFKALEEVAEHTNNLATLRSIVNHTAADRPTLWCVVDNVNVPLDDERAALDDDIVQHEKTGPKSFRKIAGRTNNPGTLTVITARNTTADNAIDDAIAKNAATRPSALAIIAARCTDPAILTLITNRNVVEADSAVVHNAATELLDLTTIANRSEDLQVLNDILVHPVHGSEEALIADVLRQSEMVRQKQAEAEAQKQAEEAQRQAALLTFSYKPLSHRPVADQVKEVVKKPAAINELPVQQQTVVFTQLTPQQQEDVMFESLLFRMGKK